MQGRSVKQEQDVTTLAWLQAAISMPFLKLDHRREMGMAANRIFMLLLSAKVEASSLTKAIEGIRDIYMYQRENQEHYNALDT